MDPNNSNPGATNGEILTECFSSHWRSCTLQLTCVGGNAANSSTSPQPTPPAHGQRGPTPMERWMHQSIKDEQWSHLRSGTSEELGHQNGNGHLQNEPGVDTEQEPSMCVFAATAKES